MTFDGGLSSKFEKHLKKLPRHVQAAAMRAFNVWREDNYYNSLQFKNIRGKKRDDIYSLRVNREYRMLGKLQGDEFITWYWVGPHPEYDRLVRNL